MKLLLFCAYFKLRGRFVGLSATSLLKMFVGPLLIDPQEPFLIYEMSNCCESEEALASSLSFSVCVCVYTKTLCRSIFIRANLMVLKMAAC